jgi:hypothetical protein
MAEPVDWFIDLVNNDPDAAAGSDGTLEILSKACDAEDAVSHLELWAELIEASGRIPPGLEWENRTPAAVIRRSGRFRYQVRLDSWEHETETGYWNGFGWLVARSKPRDPDDIGD